MENSLYSQFKKLCRSYYNIDINADLLFDATKGKTKCRDFIKEHFTKGCKDEVFFFPRDYKQRYYATGKHTHTVALYLLGLLLENQFSSAVFGELQTFIPDIRDWFSYKYTWFLTCLYHDTASCIEDTPDIPLPQTLSGYFSARNIRNYPQDLPHVPKRFSPELIASYYEYRIQSNRLEHGITAGYFFFDRMIKSFNSKTRGITWVHDQWCDSKRYLVWRKSHIAHFAYIADAIICHNIWSCTDERDVEKYRQHGLDELIIHNKCDRLYLSQFSLQFILCLLDTIEPVKRFSSASVSPKDILTNISVVFRDKNILEIKWAPLIRKQGNFPAWLGSIYSMEKWLGVTVSPCECASDFCSIAIKIE